MPRPSKSARPHQLLELTVGDLFTPWEVAGFEVADGAVTVDHTRIRLQGDLGRRGIISIAIAGIELTELDGLELHECLTGVGPPPEHPNGVTSIDHLVVTTPDADRTTSALLGAGIEPRRVRRFERNGEVQRQTFFWLGRVILELVGPDAPSGNGPAQAWGLALVSGDLDATVNSLGNRCSPPRPAVQPDRRIATLSTRDIGISTPIAFMTPH